MRTHLQLSDPRILVITSSSKVCFTGLKQKQTVVVLQAFRCCHPLGPFRLHLCELPIRKRQCCLLLLEYQVMTKLVVSFCHKPTHLVLHYSPPVFEPRNVIPQTR